MLHYWGTEDEMWDMITDPNSVRFPIVRKCDVFGNDANDTSISWVNYDPERAGYEIIEITQADVDRELATREQDQRDQRAHSWAM
jgi:hypothetical protein